MPAVGKTVRDGTIALAVSVLVCAALASCAGTALRHGAVAIAGIGLVACAAVAVGSRRDRWSGPADRVTQARTVLVGGGATVAGPALSGVVGPRPWWLVGLAVPALLLDGVDGHVARRTGTATAAGARLDMEVDATFLVVLSLVAARTQGSWVLAIGAMRYLWLGAGVVLPDCAGSCRSGTRGRSSRCSRPWSWSSHWRRRFRRGQPRRDSSWPWGVWCPPSPATRRVYCATAAARRSIVVVQPSRMPRPNQCST